MVDEPIDPKDDISLLSDEELAAEDQIWDAALAKHAGKFAQLKTQAKVDARAGKGISAFDELGNFSLK